MHHPTDRITYTSLINISYFRVISLILDCKAVVPVMPRVEGNVLFNDALDTFYLRLYGVRHMVKDNTYSEIISKSYFYMHHPTYRITYHGLCYTSRGALARATSHANASCYNTILYNIT